MSNANNLVIEDGILKKYTGNDREVIIPDGVKEIGPGAFRNCKSLIRIDIPDSVTAIGDSAFEECRSLTDIILPDSITSIGSKAFDTCFGLKCVTIPNKVTCINNKVFKFCLNLESVTIPDSVTIIGDYAFQFCPLTSVVIPDSVTSIGTGAFYGCHRLTNIVIPDRVTSIGAATFGECSSLLNIVIPDSVTSIGKGAFSACTNLVGITIPDSVISIGDGVFAGCSSLTGVIIPDSVTNMGDRAFSECSKLLFVKGTKADGENTNFAFLKKEESKISFLAYASLSKSDNLSEFAKSGSWDKYDSELINNGPQYKYRLQARLVGAVGRLIDPLELTDKNHDLLMEFACKNVKKYISLAEDARCPELITALFDLGIINPRNEKAILKLLTASEVPEIAALVSDNSPADPHSDYTKEPEKKKETFSPLERKYCQKLADINGEKIIRDLKLTGISDQAIFLTDGTQAPDFLFRFILASYCSQPKGDYHFDKDADEAAELIAYDSLCEALDAVSGFLTGPDDLAVLPMLCRFGMVKHVKRLIELWKEWDNKSRNSKYRTAKVILERCLILSDTKEAVQWLEKKNLLSEYARVRRISESEVNEKYLFDSGFDEEGKKLFDLGSTTIEASLTKDLKVELYDKTREKRIKSIPKKDIEPAVQKAAANELADLRRNLKKIAKIKIDRLFLDYIDGNEVPSSQWEISYVHNPLLRRIASLLVWVQENRTFIQTENGPVDSEGNNYSLTDKSIRLAHSMEMKTDEVISWQKYFIANNLKQPFSQVWEPVYEESDILPDRYSGIAIKPYYLKSQEKRGISVNWYDNGYYSLRDLSIKGFDVNAEDAPQEDDDYYVNLQITSIKPRKWNRRTNNVIAYLDRITIYGRIKKDDVGVMALMDGFALEQVSDFINVALENKAVNLLAALMDYKNEHFAGFDPMDSFLLDD